MATMIVDTNILNEIISDAVRNDNDSRGNPYKNGSAENVIWSACRLCFCEGKLASYMETLETLVRTRAKKQKERES